MSTVNPRGIAKTGGSTKINFAEKNVADDTCKAIERVITPPG